MQSCSTYERDRALRDRVTGVLLVVRPPLAEHLLEARALELLPAAEARVDLHGRGARRH